MALTHLNGGVKSNSIKTMLQLLYDKYASC